MIRALAAAVMLAAASASVAAPPCTPTIGADLTEISLSYRHTRHIPGYVAGALVRVVWAGGPAGLAGINAGDVIQGIGDDLVQNVCDVRQAIAKQACGKVRVTLRRGVDTLRRDVTFVDAARFRRKKLDDAAACEAGNGAGCTALAKAHDDDLVLLRQACDLGDGEGCFLLGYKLGHTAEAVAAYEQACDWANPLACNNLAWMLQNGEGVRADLAASVRLYKLSCDGSRCGGVNNLGCVNLGRMYRDGIGLQSDHPQALRIFREVCGRTPAAGNAEDRETIARACSLAGTELVFGKGIAHDIPTGLALLEKGCDANDPFGCFNLGAIYEFGEGGTTKDAARAAAYYKRACDRGDTEGCERAGKVKR